MLFEFTKTVIGSAWPRGDRSTIEPEDAKVQVERFLDLPIQYVPGKELSEHAWAYMTDYRLAPADSWYLACAVVYDAELWLSHAHADGFAEVARRIHEKVYTLTKDRFDAPR